MHRHRKRVCSGRKIPCATEDSRTRVRNAPGFSCPTYGCTDSATPPPFSVVVVVVVVVVFVVVF